MKKILFLILTAFPAFSFALDYDVAAKAMRDELARNKTGLRLKGFEKPYFISYTLLNTKTVKTAASMGALIRDVEYPGTLAYVNLRVGGPAFDNTGFEGFYPAASYAGDGYSVIRNAFWQATDQAYSDALEQLSNKKAYKQQRNITNMPPDFSSAPVTRFKEEKNKEVFDRQYFAEIARLMSAEGKKFPSLKKFAAYVDYDNTEKYYLDSLGDGYYNNPVSLKISMEAALQTADGFEIEETFETVYASVKDVPDSNALTAKAYDFAQKTAAYYNAKKAESYIGPVWFSGGAAAAFLDQTFVKNIQNSKPLWQNNDSKDYMTGSFAELKGLRVISNLFNVFDDPSAREFKGFSLAGYYKTDDEGAPGQRVDLVSRGKLVNLLTIRSLLKNQKSSNGHARGDYMSFPRAKAGNIFFEPVTTTPDLKAQLIKECARLELDYCIRIDALGGDDNFSNAYKIYTKDGREEPVYGAEINILGMRSPRDIIYAGDDIRAYNKEAFYKIPYSVITPSFIAAEMEIKPTQKKPSKFPPVKKP